MWPCFVSGLTNFARFAKGIFLPNYIEIGPAESTKKELF